MSGFPRLESLVALHVLCEDVFNDHVEGNLGLIHVPIGSLILEQFGVNFSGQIHGELLFLRLFREDRQGKARRFSGLVLQFVYPFVGTC